MPSAPPLPVRESPVGAAVDRSVAVATLAGALGMVALLAAVPPHPQGHGTHEALGMEPCGWPIHYGMPCPTCGVTTAATHLIHLEPVAAVATQPFGALLAAAGLWLAGRALVALVRGTSFVEPMVWWNWPKIGLGSLALLLASWIYKIWTF